MKIEVGIIGATGMVGQQFVSLLENHPWFDVVCLAASARSAGKPYAEAVEDRWQLLNAMPEYVKQMNVYDAVNDLEVISSQVRLIFSALDMPKDAICDLEEAYAAAGVAVVSNNSAHRWTHDVPMIMPELNPQHTGLIDIQRKNRGWGKGLIVVKPNCSLQAYLPIIQVLAEFEPKEVEVTTLQAISGAGKTFATWSEMIDNCIPFISGEEEKTEKEPLKILGTLHDSGIELNNLINISATCIRVPVADGHMASVAVRFGRNPSKKQIIEALQHYENPIADLSLPSAPNPFIQYFEQDDRPQTNMDRELGNGMVVSCGRFREDPLFGWKFVSLAHNTIRGAAGGSILTAELLQSKGYV